MEIASIPTISIICLFIGKSLKDFEKFPSKHIPFVCSIVGGLLGLVCYYTIPDMIPCTNWLSAFVVGIVSGGFSTTSHQMSKARTST